MCDNTAETKITQLIFKKDPNDNKKVVLLSPASHWMEAKIVTAKVVSLNAGQQKVERGFRFLKGCWFIANTLLVPQSSPSTHTIADGVGRR